MTKDGQRKSSSEKEVKIHSEKKQIEIWKKNEMKIMSNKEFQEIIVSREKLEGKEKSKVE